jgi:glucokinase
VAEAARAGDPLAVEIWSRAANVLGLAIGSLVNIFDPGRIVLGGGLVGSWDLLSGPIQRAMARVVMSPDRRAVDVVPSELGDNAGLVGAGLYAGEMAARQA